MSKQNVRLTTINLALMALLISSLAFVGLNRVNAQEDGADNTTTNSHECDFEVIEDGWFFGDGGFFEAIKILGIGEEAVFEELDSGKSWAEIADSNQVDPQKIVDLFIAGEETFIQELLDAGEITAEEAEEWRAESVKFIEFDVYNGWIDPFTVARQTLDLSDEAFWDALDAGKTIAEMADEKGIDPQTIIDAIIEAENDLINKEVAAGLIDAEEAEYWRKDIETFASDIVNDTQNEFLMDVEEVEFFDDMSEFDFPDDEAESDESNN